MLERATINAAGQDFSDGFSRCFNTKSLLNAFLLINSVIKLHVTEDFHLLLVCSFSRVFETRKRKLDEPEPQSTNSHSIFDLRKLLTAPILPFFFPHPVQFLYAFLLFFFELGGGQERGSSIQLQTWELKYIAVTARSQRTQISVREHLWTNFIPKVQRKDNKKTV